MPHGSGVFIAWALIAVIVDLLLSSVSKKAHSRFWALMAEGHTVVGGGGSDRLFCVACGTFGFFMVSAVLLLVVL